MTAPVTQPLTIIMYHYVRPIVGSRYPRIRGLEAEGFEGQLDYLQRHYNIVTMRQVINAASGSCALPESPVLLTFDDGYMDHYTHVYPALKRRKVSGAFFPPVCAVRDRKVLDVNKIHFVLQAEVDLTDVIKVIDSELKALGIGEPEHFYAEYRKPSRYDTGETMYVKRMLQFVLPEEERGRIVGSLFRRFVTADESSFADELYATEENWREMIDGGMCIGGHGATHRWLNKLTPAEQEAEIDQSRHWLESLGATRENFIFCYPFGGYDQHTSEILAAQGCQAAFTTKVGLANISPNSMLELERLDTNDLPRRGDAPVVEWTVRTRAGA